MASLSFTFTFTLAFKRKGTRKQRHLVYSSVERRRMRGIQRRRRKRHLVYSSVVAAARISACSLHCRTRCASTGTSDAAGVSEGVASGRDGAAATFSQKSCM